MDATKHVMHRIVNDLAEHRVGQERLPPMWFRSAVIEQELRLGRLLKKHMEFHAYCEVLDREREAT
jgi:hypothetical protein